MRDELQQIRSIANMDDRYDVDAYQFVREALCFASDVMELGKKSPPPLDLEIDHPSLMQRHLTGRELCLGIRAFAIEQFGLMAKPILNFWGIHSTNDIGEIVFNLIDAGVLMKSPEDSKSDFENVFDFDEEFVSNFEFEPVNLKVPAYRNV